MTWRSSDVGISAIISRAVWFNECPTKLGGTKASRGDCGANSCRAKSDTAEAAFIVQKDEGGHGLDTSIANLVMLTAKLVRHAPIC